MRISCLILAGGKSRFKDNIFLNLNGEPMIKHVLRTASSVFSDVIVTSKTESNVRMIKEISGKKASVFKDSSRTYSPMTCIKEGILHAKSDFVFILGADMPLVDSHTIRELLPRAQEKHDCVVYIWKLGKYEPFCAIYRKSVFYKAKLGTKMQRFIEKLGDKVFVPIAIETDEFLKVRTKKDLKKAGDILRRRDMN
jgi:molybdopterin-guanine dinucleotide biosynthesis protein A